MSRERRREKPADRKQEILTAAVALAEERGYLVITRGDIATAADCSTGLVSNYFGEMPDMRREIMREAVRVKNAEIVLQGIVVSDPIACRAPRELKIAATNILNTEG